MRPERDALVLFHDTLSGTRYAPVSDEGGLLMATTLTRHAEMPFRRTAVRVTHDVHALWLTLGRALFGGYFLYSGIQHFVNTDTMIGYTASKGVPAPELAVIGSGVLILLGGMSLLLGLWPRVGATMIAIFLVAVTPIMHNFWTETGVARMNDMAHFLKNVGLLGGACFAAAMPTRWPGSVPASHDERSAA